MTTLGSDDGLWIRRYHRTAAGAALRLVCFPHAGGSASYYYPLSEALAPDIEVLAVQYPGRQDRYREKCVDNITDLADQLCHVLARWIDRPCAFFGHSMGAILAFEVARRAPGQVQARLVRLFASGRRAPSRQRAERVSLLDDADLVAELRRAGGTDQRFLDDGEMLNGILPLIRSDYRAIETYSYVPGPPLNCPISVLMGERDPTVTMDEARAWAEHGTGELELRTYPGGHFYLDAYRAEVIDAICASLASSQVDIIEGERRAV